MQIKLNKPLGPDSPADEFDVRQIKKALNRLGYYQPYEKIGITGIPDKEVFEALRKFQQDQKLSATGTARASDETIQSLSREAAKTPAGFYVWRTARDDKVRAEHAAYDGDVRAWNDSPDPGEDFNCRCWAETVQTEKFGPHNCMEEQKSYDAAMKKLEEQNIKKESLIQELNKLRDERDQIKEELINSIGAELASVIINIPLGKKEFILELLTRYFGDIIGKKLLETANGLGQKHGVIVGKIYYKYRSINYYYKPAKASHFEI